MSIRALLIATAIFAVAFATSGPPKNVAIYVAALSASLLMTFSSIGGVAFVILGKEQRFVTGLIFIPLFLLASTLLLADRLQWLLPLDLPGDIDLLPLWGFLFLVAAVAAVLVAYFAWVIRLTLNVRIGRREKTNEELTGTLAKEHTSSVQEHTS